MELSGTIKKITDIQTFASGFQKRELIILTTEQYPQPISIEILGDKIDIVEPFKEGDQVVVGVNIRGREWVSPQGDTKYFNSIVGWKVTRAANTEEAVSSATAQTSNENPFASDDDESDLPF